VAVVHACHPKLWEKLRSEVSWMQASPGKKKFARPHLKGKNLVWWHVPVVPTIAESIKIVG
jgi:hypothetical protein